MSLPTGVEVSIATSHATSDALRVLDPLKRLARSDGRASEAVKASHDHAVRSAGLDPIEGLVELGPRHVAPGLVEVGEDAPDLVALGREFGPALLFLELRRDEVLAFPPTYAGDPNIDVDHQLLDLAHDLCSLSGGRVCHTSH